MSLNPFNPRFRGQQGRLTAICEVMRAEDVATHPTQIARLTGLSTTDANRIMAATPELFIPLPRRRDGLTRYRLARHLVALDEAGVRAEIAGYARQETLTLLTVLGITGSLAAAALVATLPLFQIP